eukprot:TRINITY_DN9190_c0_g1_i1.p1 TRINITY_DN9190_c0_g1~~TRINITY_DN9190_c0_g1_i1.p1  ORF type:complete len:129 (+),score=14.27 TRINITY_DN9190_c0_g1_i1:633-1019(+)
MKCFAHWPFGTPLPGFDAKSLAARERERISSPTYGRANSSVQCLDPAIRHLDKASLRELTSPASSLIPHSFIGKKHYWKEKARLVRLTGAFKTSPPSSSVRSQDFARILIPCSGRLLQPRDSLQSMQP